jgi:hypothetical protein
VAKYAGGTVPYKLPIIISMEGRYYARDYKSVLHIVIRKLRNTQKVKQSHYMPGQTLRVPGG